MSTFEIGSRTARGGFDLAVCNMIMALIETIKDKKDK